MKHFLSLTLLCLTGAGCMSRNNGGSGWKKAQRLAPTHNARSIAADGEGMFGRRIFIVGQQQFAELEEFKMFIQLLPTGSIVAWDSGCIRYKTIPLLHSDMTIQAFQDYCQEYGVEFRFICGY